MPATSPTANEPLSLEWLLAPMDVDEFQSTYREKEFLHVKRQDQEYYAGLFSFADVDRALYLARESPEAPITIIPPPGSGRAQERYSAKTLLWSGLYNNFHRGDTIRLGSVQSYWAPVGQLTSTLQEALEARVGVNFYLTGAGSQGFPIHFDTHDVLILQVDGSKDWSVYEPTLPLPVGSLQYANQLGRAFDTRVPEDRLRLRKELRLHSGDLLYLPRGFPHKAVASDEASLHLTVGIYDDCWADALKAAIDMLAREEVELRRNLPSGLLTEDELPEGAEERFRELLRLVAEKASLEEPRRVLAKIHQEQRFEPPDGHIRDLVTLDALTLETPVERRGGVSCSVSMNNGTARIDFGPSFVSGPAALAPALEFVRDQRRFRASELPDELPEGTRLVLVRRLVREGLLRIAHPS